MSRTELPPMRLSRTEELLLEILLNKPSREIYGLEFVREAAGAVARGSIYVLLDRMEKKGLVESRLEDKSPLASGLPRRLYKATGQGTRVLKAWKRLQAIGNLSTAFA